MYHVYMIINKINNKKYIGFTSLEIDKRFNQHMTGQGNARLLYNAVKKYGKDNFSVELIESNSDMNYTLKTLEPKYIKEYDTRNRNMGYNLSPGGNSTIGSKRTEEQKKKMSEQRKGKPRPESYGKKMSEILSGRPKTEEHKRKLSIANTGKKFSDERKKNHSQCLKGIKKKSNESYLKSNKRNSWEVIHPDGKIEIFNSLTEPCLKYNLSPSQMSRVNTGVIEKHRGFRCRKIS